MAHPARPRSHTGRRRRLPALQNARIASLPGPGAGRIGEGRAGPGAVSPTASLPSPLVPPHASGRLQLRSFLSDPRMLKLILGTAGAWFLFDYAYYGNTLSLPAILKEVNPTASLETKLLWSLGMFVIFAVPGYLLAVAKMDRIGHRRLQFIGFSVMALCFVVLAIVPALTAARGAILGHPRSELLLHSVRSEHDDLRVALRGVPGQHANHRPRHRGGHRQAGRIRRGVSGAGPPRPHRITWPLGRGWRVGCARIRRDHPAPRASWEDA